MQQFFDTIGGMEKDTAGLSISLLLMGVAFLLSQVMNGVANCYGQILNRKIGKEMNKLVFRSVERKDVISFENAEELDQIHKAIRGSEGLFWVSTTILDIDVNQKRENVELPEKFEIRLKDVSFSYPQPDEGNRVLALNHVDLNIPWGRRLLWSERMEAERVRFVM